MKSGGNTECTCEETWRFTNARCFKVDYVTLVSHLNDVLN